MNPFVLDFSGIYLLFLNKYKNALVAIQAEGLYLSGAFYLPAEIRNSPERRKKPHYSYKNNYTKLDEFYTRVHWPCL